MRLLALHSIYSEAGHHPPGSEFALEDKQDAARLIELGAAQKLDEPAEMLFTEIVEAELPTSKVKKGQYAKA